jgi:hypothetical protein
MTFSIILTELGDTTKSSYDVCAYGEEEEEVG